jgi:hypothetical protein
MSQESMRQGNERAAASTSGRTVSFELPGWGSTSLAEPLLAKGEGDA